MLRQEPFNSSSSILPVMLTKLGIKRLIFIFKAFNRFNFPNAGYVFKTCLRHPVKVCKFVFNKPAWKDKSILLISIAALPLCLSVTLSFTCLPIILPICMSCLPIFLFICLLVHLLVCRSSLEITFTIWKRSPKKKRKKKLISIFFLTLSLGKVYKLILQLRQIY